MANLLLYSLSLLPESPLDRHDLAGLQVSTPMGDAATAADESQQAALHDLVMSLPRAHALLLRSVCEVLHHHWINQADREVALRALSLVFTPLLWGPDREGDGGAHAWAATARLIAEFRAVFLRPRELRRFEEDEEQPEAAAEACPLGRHDADFMTLLDSLLGDLLHRSLFDDADDKRGASCPLALEPRSPSGVLAMEEPSSPSDDDESLGS